MKLESMQRVEAVASESILTVEAVVREALEVYEPVTLYPMTPEDAREILILAGKIKEEGYSTNQIMSRMALLLRGND